MTTDATETTALVPVSPSAQAPLSVQMDYARAVSTAALLPQAYRNKPADIMLAVGLGSAMGLTPAESLYRIDVIQGKPTASAELIAANVRKAGHKLRVVGDDTTCTATIIRADDPEFEFTVTRDVEWAKAMGLHTKDNYKKQPGTMLQWRAITAVARLACPEALYGVAHTADEISEATWTATVESSRNGDLGAALSPDEATDLGDAPEAMSDAQRRRLFAMFNERGITERDRQIAGIESVLGRKVESRGELSAEECARVMASLQTTPTLADLERGDDAS